MFFAEMSLDNWLVVIGAVGVVVVNIITAWRQGSQIGQVQQQVKSIASNGVAHVNEIRDAAFERGVAAEKAREKGGDKRL